MCGMLSLILSLLLHQFTLQFNYISIDCSILRCSKDFRNIKATFSESLAELHTWYTTVAFLCLSNCFCVSCSLAEALSTTTGTTFRWGAWSSCSCRKPLGRATRRPTSWLRTWSAASTPGKSPETTDTGSVAQANRTNFDEVEPWDNWRTG